MFFNYLKIALRNLLKKRGYSIINILGLAIGLMSVGLILLHLEHEFSFDKFHTNKDRLFKVTLERIYPTHNTFYDVIPHSYAETMASEFGEIGNYVRILGGFGGTTPITVISDNDQKEIYEELNVIRADSTFFEVFSFNLIAGDPGTVLDNPNDVVITASTADKYFGKADVIGKQISMGQAEFTITGVSEDPPENSHIQFSIVGGMAGIQFLQNVNYISFSTHTYLLLEEGANPVELEKKFPELVENYAAAQIEQSLGTSYTDYVAAGNGYRYYLRPLSSIHLDPANIETTFPGGGNLTFVRILISIAILILIIACINFMNLATARATERAKEVGIRKTLGSLKTQLIVQFLAESVLISMISMILALILINVLLPSFNSLTGNELDPSYTSSYVFLGILVFAIVVGLLAGFYPAFILSAYNPVQVLKGSMATNKSGELLRNGLVIFQFTISIILIAGTITIYQQLQFVQNKDLGFDKKQMLIIDNIFVLNDKLETFRDEVNALPGVISAGTSSAVPGGFFFGFQFQQEGNDEIITTKALQASGDFTQVLNLDIIDGRNFAVEMDDSLSIILNESAVKAFGVQDPIGRKIYANQGAPPVRTPLVIVGVVKDFHFMSLKDEISPLVIVNDRSPFGGQFNMAVKLEQGNLQETIAAIEGKWKLLVPEQSFIYDFLDTRLDGQYEDEQTSAKIFGIFAILAIFIACVGLFGLVAFTADQKTKEIGIRKVLGASVNNIILLLTRHFTILVLVSLLIAIPLAWYAMDLWLAGFAYKISLGVGTFLISGIIAILIAWSTVAYQSKKAAVINPVDSIGAE